MLLLLLLLNSHFNLGLIWMGDVKLAKNECISIVKLKTIYLDIATNIFGIFLYDDITMYLECLSCQYDFTIYFMYFNLISIQQYINVEINPDWLSLTRHGWVYRPSWQSPDQYLNVNSQYISI